MYRALLSVSGSLYNVTRDIRNWDDIQLLIQRNDYDGIIRKFSSQWEFVGDAYILIKNEYDKSYLSSNVTIIIQLRNNNWEYENIFQSNLDFSTYKDNGSIINIESLDSSIENIVKSANSTVFEYPVDEIKNYYPLIYDGLRMTNSATWAVTSDEITITSASSDNEVPLYITTSEIIFSNNAIIGDLDPSETPNYFIFVQQDTTFELHFKLRFKSSIAGSLSFRKGGSTTSEVPVWYTTPGVWVEVDQKYTVRGNRRDYFRLRMAAGTGSNGYPNTFTFESSSITATWNDQMLNPINIDIISPSNLLNRIAKSIQEISNTSTNITGYIHTIPSTRWRLNSTTILAAESIRGLTDAKIYTSLAKFREWMEAVFGYVMNIEETSSGYQLAFRHRSYFFNSEESKEIEILNDFSRKVNAAMIYSRVIAGYNKQDYNSVNGRDEFRFSNTFTTGITIKDATLSLISPYRADAYGIEFLAQKRGKDTTDTDSDTNVFFVYYKTVYEGTAPNVVPHYELRRDIEISGVMSPSTMFNAPYSPRSCIIANIAMIGACADELTFSSAEGNSSVLIAKTAEYGNPDSSGDMIAETDPIIIPDSDKIFNVNELSITTPEQTIPEDLIGLVKFTHHGKKYQGYIDSVNINLGKEDTIQYTLIEKVD